MHPKLRRIEKKRDSSPQGAESAPKPLHNYLDHKIRLIPSQLQDKYVRRILQRFVAVLAEERVKFNQEVGQNADAGDREDMHMFELFVLQLEASFIALGQLVVHNQSLVDNALALSTHARMSLLCMKLWCVSQSQWWWSLKKQPNQKSLDHMAMTAAELPDLINSLLGDYKSREFAAAWLKDQVINLV
ncbi:hypothetical protein ARMGADRAFT_1036558 [Armillaria gallica]|uniref:Uncharacterized protein n=1 Tax=Armillaria gallica TaxID=47427 RepID=A0A2H3CQE1_ARMGA|nr:hypothetical protein ARMGADRAFT_1036558 [Armillaria gallica]